MTTVQLLIVCITLLLIVVAIFGPRSTETRRKTLLVPYEAGQDVVVYLVEGNSVTGEVASADQSTIELAGAEVAGAKVGHVRIPVEQVLMVQKLKAPAVSSEPVTTRQDQYRA